MPMYLGVNLPGPFWATVRLGGNNGPKQPVKGVELGFRVFLIWLVIGIPVLLYQLGRFFVMALVFLVMLTGKFWMTLFRTVARR